MKIILTERQFKKVILNEGVTPWSVDDGSSLNITANDLKSITSALQSTLKNRAKMGGLGP